MSYFTNFARLWTSWAARLGQQTRRDEPHGQNIFSPRVDDGKWLVRAISWLRSLVSPRNFCCFAEKKRGGNKPQRTQAIISCGKKYIVMLKCIFFIYFMSTTK